MVAYNILSFLPSSMLSIACSINVRNWIFYFIRIKEAAYARKRSLEYDERNEQRLQSFHKRTKCFMLELKIGIILFFVITGISFLYIMYIRFFNSFQQKIENNISWILTTILFFIISFSYAFYGIRIMNKLKNDFPEFWI